MWAPAASQFLTLCTLQAQLWKMHQNPYFGQGKHDLGLQAKEGGVEGQRGKEHHQRRERWAGFMGSRATEIISCFKDDCLLTCSWFEFTPPALCRQAKLQRDFLVPATRLKTSNKNFPCLHLSQVGLNEAANKASVPTLDEFCRT